MGRVHQIYTMMIPRYQVFRLFYIYQNNCSISIYILLIWGKIHQLYTIIMPQNQVVSTYLYQNQTSILTDIYNFGKSTSNLRNDDAQKWVIFDLFVPNSQRYIDIYFAIFLNHKSKSHYDVQTSLIRYLFDTKITILYHIIFIFVREFKFTL